MNADVISPFHGQNMLAVVALGTGLFLFLTFKTGRFATMAVLLLIASGCPASANWWYTHFPNRTLS